MGENESGNLTIVTKNVSNLIAGSIVGSVHWHALDCPHCPAFLGHRVIRYMVWAGMGLINTKEHWKLIRAKY